MPCPTPGCPRRYAYRELHEALSPDVRLRFVEALLAFLRTTGTLPATATAAPSPSSSTHVGTETQPQQLLQEQEQEQEQEGVDDAEAAAAGAWRQRVLGAVEVLNLRCPGCGTVFLDFDACCAVECGACGRCFCGLCLAMPPAAAAAAAAEVGGAEAGGGGRRDAAHAHLVAVHGALFFNEAEIRRRQNVFRCVHGCCGACWAVAYGGSGSDGMI